MMNRSRCLVWVVAVVFSLLAFEATALGKTRVFRGRVIDFDTKQPLEGAVVVAYWLEAASAPLGEVTRLKEVKECVTDSNGEWSFVGEEGHPHNPYWYLFPLVGFLELYYTRNPNFIIFKPGYETYTPGNPCTFLAYPYVNKKRLLEGIVIEVRENEIAHALKYGKDHTENRLVNSSGEPFFPAESPESKLRLLDIPFDYSEDVRRELVKNNGFYYFRSYTIAGIKKLFTSEQRKKNLSTIAPIYPSDKINMDSFLKKQIQFLKRLDEERKQLGLEGYGYYERVKDEK